MKATVEFHPLTSDSAIRFVHGQNISAHTFPAHTHRSFSLGLVEKGQRSILTHEETFLISAGEGFLLNPHQPHVCSITGTESHDYWVISIQPDRMQTLFTEATGKTSTPYFPQVKLIDASIVGGLAAWLANPVAVEDVLHALLCNLLARYASEDAFVEPACADALTLAVQQMETRQSEKVLLQELAETAHLSPFYLNRVFRQVAGVPPHSYLLQTRIKNSLALLLETGSIATTAQRLGFADQSHFTRLFKREVGITPGQFLSLHNKEDS
ncbi:MAG TPA: AraC family transcriptional regulator [Anaerolineales bacterium]|nr:AraC family transcriptional regulator [Anaerolineales bacterium]